MAGNVVDVSVGIGLAFYWHNALALIVGFISGHFVRFMVSYFLVHLKLKFEFDFNKIKQLINFGKWVFFSNIISFFSIQLDSVVVNKFLGLKTFGIYQMGRTISNIPMQQMSGIIGTVTFPALAKMQDSFEKLEFTIIKLLRLLLYFLIPIAFFVSIYSTELVEVLLGKKWERVASVLPILIWTGAIRPISSIFETFFYSVGRPKFGTVSQFLRFIAFSLLLLPLLKTGGMIGVASSVLIGNAIGLSYLVYISINQFKMKIAKLFNCILFPTLISTLLSFSILFIKDINIFKTAYASIPIVVCAFLLYILISLLFGRFFNYNIKAELKETLLILKK